MACGGSLSPNNLIAAGGFLQNTGMGQATTLSRAVETLNNTVPSLNYQAALAAAESMGVTNVVQNVGSDILPGVAGVVPSTLQGSLGNGLQSISLLSHTGNIIGNGDLSGMVSNFNQALGFSLTSESFMGGLTELDIPFVDLGNGVMSNMNDWVTSGLGSLGDLPSLGFDLQNLGSLGAVDNLTALGDVGGFADTLINNGLGSSTGLTDALSDAGIPLNELRSPRHADQLRSIMNNLGGSDVTNIVKDQFGMSINVDTLADFTDIQKLLPTSIDSVNFDSLSEFSTSLAKVGDFSGIGSPGELGELMSSMENITDKEKLMEMSRMVDSVAKSEITNLYNGTGEFGAATMNDMIGSAAGFDIDSAMDSASTLVTSLHADGDLDNFVTRMQNVVSLEAGDYDTIGPDGSTIVYVLPDSLGTYSTYTDATAVLVSSAESTLTTIKNTNGNAEALLETGFKTVGQQVIDEQARLSSANINLTQFVANDKTNLMSFAGRLGDLGQDTRAYSTSEFLERTASDNIFGEAVTASLVEGRNRNRISLAGVRNPDLFGGMQRETFTGSSSSATIDRDGRNIRYTLTSGTVSQLREDLEQRIQSNEDQLEIWRAAIRDQDQANIPRTTTEVARVQEQTDLYKEILTQVSTENGGTVV